MSRSITDSFSMTNSNKAIVCRDQCIDVQNILLQVLDETKSISSRDVKNLKFAHDLLENVATQLASCVPWHERMAYERLKKRQEVKIKHAGENAMPKKVFPKKQKPRPKRKSTVREDIRRQEDGRAASLIIHKTRAELKVFSPGESKPSTPQAIGNLLKAAAK